MDRGMIGGASTMAAEAKREPLIGSVLQQLHMSVTATREAVGYLTERLSPVLMPETPAGTEGKQTQTDQCLPPLGDELRSMTKILDTVVKAVNYTLNRLEI